MPQPLSTPQERPGTHCTGGWVGPRACLDGRKPRPTGIRSPDRPAQLSYLAWSGPEGSRKLRFPDFMTTAQGGGKVVSLTHRPHLPPGNSPGTHFC